MKRFFDKLYKSSREEFCAVTEDALREEKRMFIVTANPEIFVQGEKEKDLQELLLDPATTLIADGIGIVKGAGILGLQVKERIPGVELAEHLLAFCSRNRLRVFLFGAKQEVLDALTNVIGHRFGGLRLVGKVNGYEQDKDGVFDRIRAAEPDLILVALGVPQQEKLIYRHLQEFSKGVFVGVGGSFDVLSGMKARAPKLFIKWNLEWLYRILKEPSRLKRFYQNNVRFLFRLKSLK